MSFSFGADNDFGGNNDLIPNGFVCWAIVKVRGLKTSANTGSRYLDLELTISEGQKHERRKIWVNVMDFTFEQNSEGARTMGLAALQHMLESSGVFRLDQPESYQQFNGKGIDDIAFAIDQKPVAIRVKVEKGTDGYADRNTVGDWLSPNPKGRGFKMFQALMEQGAHVYGAAPSSQPGGHLAFGQQAPAAPAQAPMFGAAPAAPAAPAAAPAPAGAAPAWLNQG
jgi:hypothetical protein